VDNSVNITCTTRFYQQQKYHLCIKKISINTWFNHRKLLVDKINKLIWKYLNYKNQKALIHIMNQGLIIEVIPIRS
jgi:hypothetical protein